MADEIKCPECKKEMKLLPERQPLPEAMTRGTKIKKFDRLYFQYTGRDGTIERDVFHVRNFKRSNDECWVTKLELSWS